jgi:hypothetical protein
VPEAINKTVSFGPELASWPKPETVNDSKAAKTSPPAIRLQVKAIMRYVANAARTYDISGRLSKQKHPVQVFHFHF